MGKLLKFYSLPDWTLFLLAHTVKNKTVPFKKEFLLDLGCISHKHQAYRKTDSTNGLYDLLRITMVLGNTALILEITYAGVTTFSQVDSVILNNIFYNFLGSCQDILQCPARYCCY